MRYSRRRTLALATTASAAAAVVYATGSSGSSVGGDVPDPDLWAEVEALIDGELVVKPLGGNQASVRIVPTSSAQVNRLGPATLADFERGDIVVAFGRRDGARLLTDSIEPTLQFMEAVVARRTSRSLELRDGRAIRLSSRTQPLNDGPYSRLAPSQLTAGSPVAAMIVGNTRATTLTAASLGGA